MRARIVTVTVVTAVLAAMVVLMAVPAVRESQTMDEASYVVSGLSYWTTRDFRLNIEHPPFLKELFAVPLLARGATFFANESDWNGASQWDVAPKVLYQNVVPGMTLLRDARFVNIGLTVLLVLLLTWWSYRMWGRRGAGITLVLAAFEPNLIANGHLATTDVGYALGMLAALVTFGRYLERPTVRRLVLAAAVFSLALLTRFNAVILVLLLPMEYLLALWTTKGRVELSRRKLVSAIAAFVLIGFVVVWASYGFEVRSLDRFQDEQARRALEHSGAVGQFLTTTPFPAASYVSGMFWQLGHNAGGQPAYLFGRTSDVGWWYYFPVAVAIKMTLASLALAATSAVLCARKRYRQVGEAAVFSGWYLALPMAVLLAVGMTTRLDIGVRYLLPVIGMITVAAGGCARLLPSRMNRYGVLIAALLAFNIVSVVRTFPHFIPYANEAFGGPSNLYRSLIDSNLDWGQDIPLLTAYLSDRNITDYRVSLFSTVPRNVYGLDYDSVPMDHEITGSPYYGVVVISLSQLYYPAYRYEWLQSQKPTATLGHSINIYDFRGSSR